MITWILILVVWIAFISLIVHDATKDDADGSAILIAAKTSTAFLCWAAQNLRTALRDTASRLQEISSSSKLIRQDAPGAVEQATAPSPTKMWWRKDHTASMTAAELEIAIAEAVKSMPGCEGFIGVIVKPKTQKSRRDPNWEIQGVRFGRADRKVTGEHLATIVARLQQECRLIDYHHGNPRAR